MKTSKNELNNPQDRARRVWSLLSVAALGVVLSAGSATGKIGMDVPPVLLSEADEMAVEGPRKRFRFGPYQISDFHRGTTGSALVIGDEWSADNVFAGGNSEIEQGYRFLLNQANGPSWEVECVTTVEMEPGRMTSLLEFTQSREVPARRTFACTFRQQGEEKTETLALSLPGRHNVRQTGTITTGATEIKIRGALGVRQGNRGPVIFPVPFGYHFFIDNHAVGAVRTFGKGSPGPVWLHPSATGRIRSILAAASAALLLNE